MICSINNFFSYEIGDNNHVESTNQINWHRKIEKFAIVRVLLFYEQASKIFGSLAFVHKIDDKARLFPNHALSKNWH